MNNSLARLTVGVGGARGPGCRLVMVVVAGGDGPRQGAGKRDYGMVLVMRGGWGATRAVGSVGRCVGFFYVLN